MGKVLVTGASGFLGKYITRLLKEKKIPFITLGRDHSNNVVADLTQPISVCEELSEVEYVVHAAGKAHMVPRNEEEKQEMFRMNTLGTQHLLDALPVKQIKSIVFISSVAVYGKQSGELFSENEPLNATDSYGKSKIEAEQLITDYCKRQNINCCILRLPLIAGVNPPGNLETMIKAMRKGTYFRVGKGEAKKSIVLAADVAELIPRLFDKNGTYNLSDGHHPSFAQLEEHIAHELQLKKPLALPYLFIKMAALAGDILGSRAPINSSKLDKITKTLTFSDTKAVKELNWYPHPVINTWKDIA